MIYNIKLALIPIFLIFSNLIVFAGDRVFRTFAPDQLSFNVVYSVAQDHDGFIWSGGAGIYRFDGNNIIDISDLYPGQNLPGNAFRVIVDSAGQLWILGYYNDLYCCNPTTRIVTEVISSNSTGAVFDIKQGLGSDIIAGTDSGLLRIDIHDHSLKWLSGTAAYAVGQCPDGSSCVSASYNEISFFDSNYEIVHTSELGMSPVRDIRNMHQTGKNEALLGGVSAGGLWLYRDGKTVPLIDNVSVYNIIYNRHEDTYWIATDEGIYIYDRHTSRLENIHKISTNPFSLPDNFVCSLMQDSEGGMWVGTYFKGLCYCPNLPVNMSLFSSTHANNGFKGTIVRGFEEDDYGNLWISTEDEGLNKLDKRTGNYINYSKKSRTKPLCSINIRGSLAIGDELWIATLDNGIDVMDIRTGRILRNYNTHNSKGLGTNAIHCLCLWHGDLYIGTGWGLFRFDVKTQSFQAIHSGIIHYVTSLYVDSQDRLWSTSYYKVCRMDDKGLTIYEHNPDDPNSVAPSTPYHVNEDSDNNIWIAGFGGLSMFTGDETAPFINHTLPDALQSHDFYRVEPDSYGTLWCSSSQGLARYNPSTNQAQIYASKDYLNNSRFYNSSYQDPDGNIYVGTLDGYVRVTPEAPAYSTDAPEIYLTKVSYKHPGSKRDTSVYHFPPERTDFRHFQNSIGFEYAVPEYTLLRNVEYSYRLKGFDSEFTHTTLNQPVVYQNLPPGDYTFVIAAKYLSGAGGKRFAEYEFRIRPPFTSSVLGYILYGILALGLVTAILLYRQKQLLRRQREVIKDFETQKDKELYNARILFFTNVAHEIRTPLTLIKLPLEQLGLSDMGTEEAENLELIEKNVDRLTQLCTQLLDFRSSEKDSLYLNFVRSDVNGILTEVLSHFQAEIRRKGIKLEVDSPEKIVAAVDTEAFTKICTNLVGNAVKYCSSEIRIRLAMQPETFSVSVMNDGELIPAADSEKIFTLFYRSGNSLNKVGSGIGLAFTKQLAEMHNGNLKLLFDEAGYNHFCMTLPLSQEVSFDTSYTEGPGTPDMPLDPGKDTILLAEDDQLLRSYEVQRLSAKYNVIAVSNGQEALDILQNQNMVSLVVSDIMMPVVNGLTLCSRIKSSVELSHIPVILLTSKEDAETKLESLAYGADDYITKPFSMEYLRLRIDNIIGNRKKIYRKVNTEGINLMAGIAVADSEEGSFLKRFCELVDDELGNSELDMDYLADKMNVSRSALYKKVKAAADISPNDYIRIARLKRAVHLLVNEQRMIKDVAYSVGFSSTTYFSTCFVKQYGMSPTEFLKDRSKVK